MKFSKADDGYKNIKAREEYLCMTPRDKIGILFGFGTLQRGRGFHLDMGRFDDLCISHLLCELENLPFKSYRGLFMGFKHRGNNVDDVLAQVWFDMSGEQSIGFMR